jgi:hypothetical protein
VQGLDTAQWSRVVRCIILCRSGHLKALSADLRKANIFHSTLLCTRPWLVKQLDAVIFYMHISKPHNCGQNPTTFLRHFKMSILWYILQKIPICSPAPELSIGPEATAYPCCLTRARL